MLWILVAIKNYLDRILVKRRKWRVDRRHLAPPAAGCNILVIRLDHKIGDMVCFSAFLKSLRHSYSKASITLVLHSSQIGLYEHCPYVDQKISFDWGRSLPLSLNNRIGRIHAFVQKSGLKQDWDLAIVSRFDEDFHAPFLAYASGARRRVAFSSRVTSRKAKLLLGTDALYTEVYPSTGTRHEVERNLELIERLVPGWSTHTESVAVETWLADSDIAKAREVLNRNGVDPNQPRIGIGLGAYDPKRIWPVERYAQIIAEAKADSQLGSYQFILLGASAERDLGEKIQGLIGEKAQVINLAGETSIRVCAAILRSTRAFVGNDSGLLHLAAASGCACVEISCHPLSGDPNHPNSPIRFGPYTRDKVILQPQSATAPCKAACVMRKAHCIEAIQPDAVLSALRTLLQGQLISGDTL